MPRRNSPTERRPAVRFPRRRIMPHHLSRTATAVAAALACAGMAAAPAVAAPTPHRGRTAVVTRISGTVRIREPHGRTVTLHGPVALANGGTLDTTGGVAAVTVATRHGDKTAEVSHGDSRVTQTADATTTFTLQPLSCGDQIEATHRRPPTDTLWTRDNHGPFVSKGTYASGAARGTDWTTTDTCSSTTIHVRQGKVLVTDFRRHRHVLLSAGHSYTAPAPSPLTWSAPEGIGDGSAVQAVSCPSSSFCAAANSDGDVLTSTDPAGGPATWQATSLATGSIGLTTITCPTETFCATTDDNGDVLVSTDPTGGPSAWTATNIVNPDGDGIEGLTCPSTTLCVAVDSLGNVITSTDPTGGVWSTAAVSTGTLDTVACAGTGLCLALGADLAASIAPTGGTATWRTTSALSGSLLACPSATVCAIDGLGPSGEGVYVSTSPTGGPSTYHLIGDPGHGNVEGFACPSAGECIVVDDNGYASVNTDLTGDHWTSRKIDSAGFLDAISCPSTSFCLAGDQNGDALVGTAPGGSTSGDVIGGTPRTPRRVTAAAAATRVVVMAGFTVGGVPTMRISRTVRGSCFSTSAAALRDDAYRCTSGNELFDPCLAPPASVRAGHVVVCPTDPFGNTGIEIRLTRPLPRNDEPAPSERGIPFAVRLTNGCEAMLDTGATAVIGRERANYYCARTHQALWGTPSRRGRVWTIWSAPPNAKRLSRRVPIAEAWF
jgi:hypothetical protein